MAIDIRTGSASLAEIERHLHACSDHYVPPLAARVSISDYARRLARGARLSEAWEGDRLIGLVAVYCNAEDRKSAFITNVSIEEAHQGTGLARRLLNEAITHVRSLGFSRIELEADARAHKAIALYQSLGFHSGVGSDTTLNLSMDLRAN